MKKRNTFDRVNPLYEGRELALSAFKSGIFPLKRLHGKGLKILTPEQMLQRLYSSIASIALAQVKAGNTSENLLNEILEIKYSLYRAYNEFRKVIKQNIYYTYDICEF